MLEIYQRLDDAQIDEPDYKLLLTHDERCRARLKTKAVTGVRIDGAAEPVLSATCDEWRLFARACYHLGNRHVKIQVAERTLRITPDHVLQSMLESLGLTVRNEMAVFVPENGAYHGHGHSHSHDADAKSHAFGNRRSVVKKC